MYLDDVVVDSDGNVTGFSLAFAEDPGGPFAWDHGAVRVYCANDHDINWSGVHCDELPRLSLTPPRRRAEAKPLRERTR